MKFKRLRLSGFKSFVDPVDFDILPGLTGIVGPNGCGKSNLLEALRWVMGETSYKSMRGAAMEDVIFSGTNGRPARNHAEVSLVLDNRARTASAEFNDSDVLEVSRRIEREAGSAYRINGQDVRARDVQLLFADASTGARSNSLVRQGQIGELISAKPESRRRILEEAAGISGLHSRRHQAELRLKAAQGNLEKLDEVLAALESQLRSLKRQARQAGRYKEISEQMRATEALALYLRWKQAAERLAQTEAQLKQAQSAVAGANGRVANSSATLANTQATLPDLRTQEAQAAAALRRLTLERENMDNELRQAQDMLVRLREQATTIAEDRKREHHVLTDSDQQLAALVQEENTAKDSISAQDSEAEAVANTQVEKDEADLRVAEAAFDAANRAVADYGARLASLREALDNNATQAQRLTEEIQKLQTTRADIENTSAHDFDLSARQATLADLQNELEAAQAAYDTQKQHHADMLAAHDKVQTPAREARALLARLTGERDALTSLYAVAKSHTPAHTPIVSHIEIQAGYETALAAALGDDLDAALDEAAPIYWLTQETSAPQPPLPDNVKPLADYVSGAGALARRLSQIGLVETRAQGMALQSALKMGQRLVSKAGDFWRWDGYCRTAEAETNATRRLAQKQRLEGLQTEIQQAEADAQQTEATLAATRSKLEQARRAYEDAQQNLQAHQQRVNICRQELSQAEAGAATGQAKLGALESTQARLQSDLETTQQARTKLDSDLRALENAGDGARDLEEQQIAVNAAREVLAQSRATLQNWRSQRETRDRQLQRIHNERASWTARRGAAEKQLQILETRHSENQAETEKFTSIPQEIEAKKIKIADLIAEAEQTRQQAADVLAQAEATLTQDDKAHQAAQAALAEAREAQARLEATKESDDQRLAEAVARIHDTLQITPEAGQIAPEAALSLANHDENTPFPEIETLESQLESFRRERENLGGVNLRADEETQEITAQIEEMKTERDDLAGAVNKLRYGIGQLNREGRQRLLAAFETVNGHFERLFTRLFGGGTARLELTESDDPLEAGLEILAHPPGKRPQHMSLLSGGEQALTAVALIFAVFLTNPSPICVLDEVDAPLDDSNVDRFCTLVRDIATETGTHFLVITHHALTMARMDRLFGVTMQERGVSQLLSVNLETAEQFAETGRPAASRGENQAQSAG